MADRILLSPPHLDGREQELVAQAIASNWIAPVGPHLGEFERAIADRLGRTYAVALSSGTAALHLGLIAVGVTAGDDVLVATLTFAGSVNPITYLGAAPVFVDSDPNSWNIDVSLVEGELERRNAAGLRQPAAIVPVDLYGRCADYTALMSVADQFGVPVVADAAESLGATHRGRPAGSFGQAAILSFNGNKIITTSGGGMLVTDDEAIATRVRKLATQAREPAAHYEHHEVGFNYRMSNLLAALGIGQLERLDDRVARRREINAMYRNLLSDIPGLTFPIPDTLGRETNWLTCVLVDPDVSVCSRDEVIAALSDAGIEARPTWKPMHLQPVFSDCQSVGGAVAEEIFHQGLCLPSGSSLTNDELSEVAAIVRGTLGSR